MADIDNSMIFKILNGPQNGVEVALEDGEYTVGSGSDDDLQITDIALKPGHASLRISGGSMSIGARGGRVRTSTGLDIEDGGSEWHEIDQLDVITVGSTRLAIGKAGANWGALLASGSVESDAVQAAHAAPVAAKGSSWRFAMPVMALAALLGLGAVALANRDMSLARLIPQTTISDVEQVREAVNAFPFADDVTVREEVDGTIYAQGFTDTLIERRAISDAVRETGVPVRMRLWVRAVLRNEIESLIAAKGLPVSYDLRDDGDVVLTGTVLDGAKASDMASTIDQQVVGVGEVRSDIRTAETVLQEVRDLAARSGLREGLLFRLATSARGTPIIEATGAVRNDQVDAWIGFLKSYSAGIANTLALRSFVGIEGQTLVENVIDPATGNPTSYRSLPIIISGASAGADIVGRQVPPELLRDNQASYTDLLGVIAPGYVSPAQRAADEAATPDDTASEDVDAGEAGADGDGATTEAASPAGDDANGPDAASGETADAGADTAPEAAAAAAPTRLFANLEQSLLGITEPDPQPGVESDTDAQADAGAAPGAGPLPAVGTAAVTAGVLADTVQAKRVPIPRPDPERDAADDIVVAADLPDDPPVIPVGAGSDDEPSGDSILADLDTSAPPVAAAPVPDGATTTTPDGAAAATPDGASAATPNATPAAPETVARSSTPPGRAVRTGRPLPAEPIDRDRDADLGRVTKDATPEAQAFVRRFGRSILARGANSPAARQSFKTLADATTVMFDVRGGAGLRTVLGPQRGGALEDALGNVEPVVVDAARKPLPAARFQALRDAACWNGSRISADMLPVLVFWLDLLSVSAEIALDDLVMANRGLLLEAGLSPRRVQACLERQVEPGLRKLARSSVYLAEATRNPRFIEFLTRSTEPFELDIVGARTSSNRYVQLGDGLNLVEGSAPTSDSRIASIGELGVLLRVENGYQATVYPQTMPWHLK